MCSQGDVDATPRRPTGPRAPGHSLDTGRGPGRPAATVEPQRELASCRACPVRPAPSGNGGAWPDRPLHDSPLSVRNQQNRA